MNASGDALYLVMFRRLLVPILSERDEQTLCGKSSSIEL